MLCTLGMGLAFTPVAVAATGGVPREEAGLASGVMNTSRQIGASLGLAVLSTVAADRIAALERGHRVSSDLAKTAMTAGYARGFQVAALMALAAVALTFIIPASTGTPPPPSDRDPSEVRADGMAAASDSGPAGTPSSVGSARPRAPKLA